MSTLSMFERDESDRLAKRYAALAVNYFDAPAEARKPAAGIPLENLFRILQMFRYSAFSDESRRGVLQLEGFGDRTITNFQEGTWHRKIEGALNAALADVFGPISKDDALSQVQAALAWLATNKNTPPNDVVLKSRAFLQRFEGALT